MMTRKKEREREGGGRRQGNTSATRGTKDKLDTDSIAV